VCVCGGGGVGLCVGSDLLCWLPGLVLWVAAGQFCVL